MKKLSKNKQLIGLMIITLMFKLILLVVSSNSQSMNLGWGGFQFMNPDEEGNFNIAINYLENNKYSINGRLTSFHGSFTVFVYKFLIENELSKYWYIIFYHVLSIIIFVISIPFFYNLSFKLSNHTIISMFSTILYCFYPSNLIFIGNIFTYEKFVLPLLIINFSLLFNLVKSNEYNILIFLIPLTLTLSCLLRAQVIIIYSVIFIFFIFYSVFYIKKHKLKIIFWVLTFIIVIVNSISHIPILIKNHNMFGSYILSTQLGFELMQGHNDLARGSWNPGIHYDNYSREKIPNLANLNEHEISLERKIFAVNWLKNNPFKELELIIRKTAIFLLPRNYEAGFNPINIFVHFCFLWGVALTVIRRKFDSTSFLIVSPILGVYILSIIFFVGFRWRYYAEPFFILLALYQILEYAYDKQWLRRK